MVIMTMLRVLLMKRRLMLCSLLILRGEDWKIQICCFEDFVGCELKVKYN
jgi:hypothetical protein